MIFLDSSTLITLHGLANFENKTLYSNIYEIFLAIYIIELKHKCISDID
jgi:hypothetical protein